MTVLKLDASAREKGANTCAIGDFLLQHLRQPVIERHQVRNPLPPRSPQGLVGVLGSHKDEHSSRPRHLAIPRARTVELNQADALKCHFVANMPSINMDYQWARRLSAEAR